MQMKEKLSSRKFWMSLIGLITGISLIFMGNPTEGASTIIASVVSYLLAEGLIDARAVGEVYEVLDDVKGQMNAEQ